MNTAQPQKSIEPQDVTAIPANFKTDAWYHALTLIERIISLNKVSNYTLKETSNADLARRRLQRWRSQLPFTTDSYFAQRLTIDGITEDKFVYILGESDEAIHNRFPEPPIWLKKLTEAFSDPASAYACRLPPTKKLQGKKVAGFLYAIEPLILQGCNRLDLEVQVLIKTQSALPFDYSKIEAALFKNLQVRLLMMLSRTLFLELQVARFSGFLLGDTPEERFCSFLERLRQHDTALTLLQEYPVLARQLTNCIDQWVTFHLEFLHHLCTDWDTIRNIFSPDNDPGLLVQVNEGVGDSHRGGRCVLIAKFSSGFQLVYKPRSLAVEVHFQELLSWVNDRGDHPPFKTLKILDRGTYGWVEFVAPQSCISSTEVWRFYERQGGYLALLYALEATDFHFENLIAAGEHPILLDLEALFHPRFEETNVTQPDLLASHTITYSVLGVMLLPQHLLPDTEYEDIDVSGLGAKEGQLTPEHLPHWEDVGTDQMHFTRQQGTLSGSQHQPTLDGNEINVIEYTEAIIAGFTNIYRLLLKHRNDLLSEAGPLARFAEDEIRVILRPTRLYSRLLEESFHPDVLRNALDRDRLFDRLWFGIEYYPYLAQVIKAEYEDLQRGDIPMFITRPSSRDLWSGFNNKPIANFLNEPGMALVKRRMQQLSEDDLARQQWFVRASLATLVSDTEPTKQLTYPLLELQSVPDHEQLREQLLAGAQAVGKRLEWLALRGEDNASWICLKLIKERYWSLVPIDVNLYDGLSGVVMFLAYLGKLTQEERYTALATDGLTNLRRQQQGNRLSITSIGGFEGWGGLIYVLTHLGVLWNESALLAEAEELAELLPPLIEQNKQLDIVGGAAGCIGSLLSLYYCKPSQRILSTIIQCGERLIACMQPMEQGIGWLTTATKPLAGFAHGAAGIAWALLELAALTGEERFRKLAIRGIIYERSLFSPKVGNWYDLRRNDNQAKFMTAWCHGAPGIGLARLRSLPHFDDVEVYTEIQVALETTLAHGFGINHSLCHGDLGNLELLLLASKIFKESEWPSQVNRLTHIILDSIRQHGWLCGNPLRVETPGLMTGLAGIGYGLLRLAEPEIVPSALLLEPPKLKGRL
ncbi:MAG: type 2 lanthipeptide synthetase LanM family protein [Rhizonema sp. PD37]|nr:type 2 lanthipeptide synthetase LanM family protein [Rhizonema sp. PD37]